MDSTERFIREKAAAGWSRKMVKEALGIADYSWREICSILHDVKWPPTNGSVDRKAYYESQRGHCSPARLDAVKKAHASREANLKKYTVGSITTYLEQHLVIWADEITIGHSQIRRRLAAGADIYDALFSPPKIKRKPQSGWHKPAGRIDAANHQTKPLDRAAAERTKAFLAERALGS